MEDFANMISIIPVEFTQSVTAGSITPKNGFFVDTFFSENDMKFSESPENKDAGEFFNQSVKVVIPRLSGPQRSRYARNRKVYVILYKCDGEKIVWGDMDMPCTISFSPALNFDQISLTRKALKPLL